MDVVGGQSSFGHTVERERESGDAVADISVEQLYINELRQLERIL